MCGERERHAWWVDGSRWAEVSRGVEVKQIRERIRTEEVRAVGGVDRGRGRGRKHCW